MISVGTTANGTSTQNTSSLTFSATQPVGRNGCMVVQVSGINGAAVDPVVSSVTYGGQTMTLGKSQLNGNRLSAIYYLVNPPTGANNVVITLGASITRIIGGAIPLTGVDVINPVDVTGGSSLSSTTNWTTSVTVVRANSILIDAATTQFAGTLTANSSQTTVYNLTSDNTAAGGYKIVALGTQTMAWTASSGVTGSQAVLALKEYLGPETLGEYLPNAYTKGYWRLNGNSNDTSGNGNNGTDSNITYSLANGKFGQGAGFNGTSSKITANLTQPTSAYTISLWITDGGLTVSDTNYRITDSQESGATPNTGVTFAYNPSLSGATKNLRIYHNNGSWVSSNDLGSLLSTGWHNVIATWDGSTISFYVDGTSKGGGAYSTAITNGGHIDIGHGRASATWWKGNIDEVIIENRAWTASEIKKYYARTKGRFITQLI